MGGELLDRPRHGRIRLRERWIHFPLKPVDLALRLDPRFALGAAGDAVRKVIGSRPPRGDSYADVLRAGLGDTICDSFYFPYARKIWGREPSELSGIQARRRVSASSFSRLARKVASQIPGFKPPGAGRFYYPRRGYGAITEAYADAAKREGTDLRLGWRVDGLTSPSPDRPQWLVSATCNDERATFAADYVWSTIPIPLIARFLQGLVPSTVTDAAGAIEYRAMLLVYLALDIDRFTEFDAHYFPGSDVRITRLSEPKNYADLAEPRGSTVLCAELPCGTGDDVWSMSDAALGELVARDLATAGIPLPVPPAAVQVRRLKQAYPIYSQGYEKPFEILDTWVDSLPRLLSFGRQGLFAHDNTHHALFMAYSAADCLDGGEFDHRRWRAYRDIFATHVVED
jgi:protoporphyrinogen oxidase